MGSNDTVVTNWCEEEEEGEFLADTSSSHFFLD